MRKNIFILIFLLLATGFVKAQTVDGLIQKRMSEAYFYTLGYLKPYYPEKAFGIYIEYANKGIPQAMNAVGIMYLNGSGVEVNYNEAAQWFEKAGILGYPQGWYNLGMIHKYSYGVKQDFEKAYLNYKKAADMGFTNGKYAAGYMLYKGFGCKQDYLQAFALFNEAANLGHAGSMYMLGLCYRNGYGTERDTLTCKKWLKKSDSLKYYMAKVELASKEPENVIVKKGNSSARIISPGASINDIEIPKTYRLIRKNILQENLSGEYVGYVITFDYSGEHIIKQVPLKLKLNKNGEKISGEWIEANNITAEIKAVYSDSSISFESSAYKYSDHYNQTPIIWHFKNANVEIIKKNNTIQLAGNLQLFSPETMEPEKPIYISLTKVEENSSPKLKGELRANINNLIAFPNPFATQLNLSFELKEASKIEITLFNMVGVAVYKAAFDSLPKGKNLQSLPINISTGIYIVKVASPRGSVSSFIVRQ